MSSSIEAPAARSQTGDATTGESEVARARWSRLGEVIDALISTDLTARGISHELYQAARETTDYPLAMEAALRLHERVSPGDVVLICTGWPSRSWLMSGLTETDGPVGAGHLARAVEECLGAVPVVVTEESLVRYSEVALASAGLIVSDVQTAVRSKAGPHSAAVAAAIGFTTDWADAEQKAKELFDSLSPAAVVSIEMPGATEQGEFFNVTGRTVPSNLVAKADAVVREATSRGALTVGVGDGGNELGMGRIAHAVETLMPRGRAVTPATPVDVLVVGSISNWGAVGVSAALSALAGKIDLLSRVDLMRITERVSDAGAIDGLTAYVDPKNDGTDAPTNVAFVSMLQTAVKMHSSGWLKG